MSQIKFLLGLVLAVLLGMFSFASASNPVIVTTNPPQNGLNALVATSIEVQFDVDMDEATFTNSNFTVNALYSGRHMGTFVYDGPSRTVTFTSSRSFLVSEVVTVVLTTGIQSLGGEPVSQSYGWSFTVEVLSGYGVFENTATYDIPNVDWPMVSGDFDNDGDIDVAISSHDSLTLTILVNSGDATFTTNSIEFSEDVGAVSVTADFNNDGYLDLSTDASGILLNTGDGSFVVDSIYRDDRGVFESCAGDFNGDGAMDLAITLNDFDVLSVMLNLGDGTFAPAVEYYVGISLISVDAADFDGDGDIDLAANSYDSVIVLFNNGDGSFSEIVDTYPNLGGALWTLTSADIDADGDVDILIGNLLVDDLPYGLGAVSLLVNEANGSFIESPYVCSTRDGLIQISVVDFDADGRLDIAGGSLVIFKQDVPTVFLLWNNEFGGVTNYVNYVAGTGMSRTYLFADLDGDGDIDVAVNDYIAGNVFIHLNQEASFVCGDANSDGFTNVGDAVFLINYVFKGGPPPIPLEEGDVNCDDLTNVGDAVYLIQFVFNNGPEPCADCP